jgi:hypothetical protein
MSKFGMKKSSIHDRAAAEQVAHKHVPGRAYEVGDPVAKLIHTIGGGFFNEPKYFDSNRSAAAFYAELLTTGRISSKIVDETGLTEQAREVVETATAGANGASPEDLLVIAAWARDTENGLKLRSMPQFLLALAAAHPKTKPFVPKYATAVMRRADEIRHVFGAFRDLFMSAKPGEHPRQHRGSLPRAAQGAGPFAGDAERIRSAEVQRQRPSDLRRRAEDGRRLERDRQILAEGCGRKASQLAGQQGNVRVSGQRPLRRTAAAHP